MNDNMEPKLVPEKCPDDCPALLPTEDGKFCQHAAMPDMCLYYYRDALAASEAECGRLRKERNELDKDAAAMSATKWCRKGRTVKKGKESHPWCEIEHERDTLRAENERLQKMVCSHATGAHDESCDLVRGLETRLAIYHKAAEGMARFVVMSKADTSINVDEEIEKYLRDEHSIGGKVE